MTRPTMLESVQALVGREEPAPGSRAPDLRVWRRIMLMLAEEIDDLRERLNQQGAAVTDLDGRTHGLVRFGPAPRPPLTEPMLLPGLKAVTAPGRCSICGGVGCAHLLPPPPPSPRC